MTRNEMDKSLLRLKELWAEVDAKPRPGVIDREIKIKRATNILQTLADNFDAQRA